MQCQVHIKSHSICESLTLDENAEGVILHHSQSHHELIIRREGDHVSIFIYSKREAWQQFSYVQTRFSGMIEFNLP